MFFNRIQISTFIFSSIFIGFQCISQSIVSTNQELSNVIQSAVPGSVIILKNKNWTNIEININKQGTYQNPITIKAETTGQVFFEGNSSVHLGGSYIYFEGVTFQNASNLVVSNSRIDPILEFRDNSGNECNNCKITNIKIDSYNGTNSQSDAIFKWILVYGQYNEISYSSFLGKYGVGSVINDNRNDNDPNYTIIHHNYFADRTPVGDFNALNDQDAIRIGNSSTSMSDSYTEVYNNYFNNWSGEIEIISNKSGFNKYYNNTFRNYQGSLTLRHGNDNEVFGNYFFANNNNTTAGIRVIGENQLVYNNYIEGINSYKEGGSLSGATGGINITNGRVNSALNGYFQVKNSKIVNNTFVNCDYAIRIGTKVSSDLSLAPENLIIANNIMLNSSHRAISVNTTPTGASLYQGNITENGSWDIMAGTNSNIISTSLSLVSDDSFFRLNNGSSAIDAGVGNYDFVSHDILGGSRSATFDSGAEEFGSNGNNLPYTDSDIGITVGFGGSILNDLDLVINSDMSSSEDISCNNLTINTSKILIINSGHTLMVNGNLTSHGTLIIESGASLITKEGNTVGQVTINRNTHGSALGYSFVGSPVDFDAEITGLNLGSISFSYDETQTYAAVGGPRWVAAASSPLIPGIGYAQANQSSISFTGVPNDGSITVLGLTYTVGNANEQGWNLLSNPYPAAISAQAFTDANPSLEAAIYLWNDPQNGRATIGDYLTVTALGSVNGNFNGNIGSMQGFFVKLKSAGIADVTFTEAMRVNGNNADDNFFRKAEIKTLNIKLAIETTNGLYNETLIGLRSDAKLDADIYDASKFIGNENIAFYSLINGNKYAIQGLPIEQGISTELAFNLGSSANLKLSVVELTGLGDGMTFLLTDKVSGKIYDLSEVNSIDFAAAKGSDQSRFKLTYLSKLDILTTKNIFNQPIFKYQNNELIIQFNTPQTIEEFTMYDLLGRVILKNKLSNMKTNELHIHSETKGVKIIRISTGDATYTKRLLF